MALGARPRNATQLQTGTAIIEYQEGGAQPSGQRILGFVSKREPNALASGRQGQFNASWLPEASAYGSRDGHFWSFETGPSVTKMIGAPT